MIPRTWSTERVSPSVETKEKDTNDEDLLGLAFVEQATD
jgi:hypothetical protein